LRCVHAGMCVVHARMCVFVCARVCICGVGGDSDGRMESTTIEHSGRAVSDDAMVIYVNVNMEKQTCSVHVGYN
jgi:hypothetical protein